MARQDASVSVERFFQFSVLGMVASGYLAVAGSGYLDIPTIALTSAGLLLRALLISGVLAFEFSERLVTAVTLAYMAFFGLDYLALSRSFLSATVHLVFFLAVVKILTATTSRDHLLTAIIAFLELLAGAILSINLNFFAFLALFLLFAIAALTSAEIRRSLVKSPATARSGLRRFHPRLALLAAGATGGILVLTAGLFFFLPRTADAAFAHLINHRIFLPGFSNNVTLGEIGEIQTSSQPVMHISVYSSNLPKGLKWRGGALVHFDGKRWFNPRPRLDTIRTENGHILLPAHSRQSGEHISYIVDLDALDTDALFFAGTPEQVDLRQPSIDRTETDSYRLGRMPPPGFRYEAYSLLEEPPESSPLPNPEPELTAEQRAENLELPRLDPRIPQLARQMTATADTDLARARAIESHLRRDFGYTLSLPATEPADPLAYFLFTRKKGHCEYFASAMAVMLRSLGIPARLATGFQTGIYNPITDLWLIRASDAHSWVEAWMPGLGWTTFDPTPPDANPHIGFLTEAGLYLDAAQTFWQEWVVSYDPSHQGSLADKFEQDAGRLGIRWFDSLSGAPAGFDAVRAPLRRYTPGVVLTLLIGALLWTFGPPIVRMLRLRRRVSRVRRGHASVGDATILYERMLDILKHRGYQKPLWFTPLEFAASLPVPINTTIAEFTAAYNAMRYGGRTDIAADLSRLLDELQHQDRSA